MSEVTLIGRYNQAKVNFFKWRFSLALIQKLGLALIMALFTGVMAQIRIYLPSSPVPITGQTFAVLISGVVCGGVFGSLSQIIYLTLGFIGFPLFAAFSPSTEVLIASPTGGYLLGFVIAPFIIGKYTDSYISQRTFFSQLKLMLIGVGVIYFCGAVVLAAVMDWGIQQTLVQGVIPFVLFDIFKAVCAASLGTAILPRSAYNEEFDKKE